MCLHLFRCETTTTSVTLHAAKSVKVESAVVRSKDEKRASDRRHDLRWVILNVELQ